MNWEYFYAQKDTSSDSFGKWLNGLGADGWELVTAARCSGQWDLIFKKPRPSPQTCCPEGIPPGEWKEISKPEIVNNRSGCNNLKRGDLMADYDILTKWLKYSPDEANEMVARLKKQKLEDLKLQVMAQNPMITGIRVPFEEEKPDQNAVAKLLDAAESLVKKLREKLTGK